MSSVLNDNPLCPLKAHLRCYHQVILILYLNISQSEFSAGHRRMSNMLISYPLTCENGEMPKMDWKPGWGEGTELSMQFF